MHSNLSTNATPGRGRGAATRVMTFESLLPKRPNVGYLRYKRWQVLHFACCARFAADWDDGFAARVTEVSEGLAGIVSSRTHSSLKCLQRNADPLVQQRG